MANLVGTGAASRTDELPSVTLNPLPIVTTKARRRGIDVTLVVPHMVDPNWFEATWYGKPREPHAVAVCVLALTSALKVVRLRLVAWAVRPAFRTVRWQGQ